MTYITLTGLPEVVYRFRGNSLYDPDFEFGGQQPLGFDEWSNFYERYRVLGSSIRLQILNNISTNSGNTNIVLIPLDSNVGTAHDNRNLSEMPYSRSRMLAPISGGTNGAYMKHYISTKKITGIKYTGDDRFYAAMSTNPNRLWYWFINAASFDEISNVDLTIKVSITYYSELSGRKELLRS